ncbi:uncharacterized protein L203_103280 [Cryptococcus depauperatus CBS 7841]|uniref:Uncharacterized protein n=1 Tax=Cryptococcus depauperatus CBS 7841 TaxID=1295531 RepID=A0A1E3HF29_9TREE|nr:hypothetical protein L203_06572 [Cryptococcus depauperatus CBS 7841]
MTTSFCFRKGSLILLETPTLYQSPSRQTIHLPQGRNDLYANPCSQSSPSKLCGPKPQCLGLPRDTRPPPNRPPRTVRAGWKRQKTQSRVKESAGKLLQKTKGCHKPSSHAGKRRDKCGRQATQKRQAWCSTLPALPNSMLLHPYSTRPTRLRWLPHLLANASQPTLGILVVMLVDAPIMCRNSVPGPPASAHSPSD